MCQKFCITLTEVKPTYRELLKTLEDIILLLKDCYININCDQIPHMTQTLKLLRIEDIQFASEAKSEEEDIVKVEIDDEKEEVEDKQDEHSDNLVHVDLNDNAEDEDVEYNPDPDNAEEEDVEYNPDPSDHDVSSEDEKDEDFEVGGFSKKGKRGRPRNSAYGTSTTCPVCGKDYSTRHIMIAHYHKAHTEKGKKSKQPNNDLELTIKSTPRKKRGPKTGPRKTSTLCPVCGKNYTTRQIMLSHYRLNHTEEGESKRRPTLCGECGATFASYQTYLHHMKYKHTDQSFQCDQCEFKCSQKSNLTSHIRYVHEKVLFYCDQCEESFRRKLLLDAHIRVVHQGIRLKCDHCEYQADRKDQLKRHYRYAHLKIKYTCEICDAQYAGNHNLKDHMARVHNIGTPLPNYRKNKLKDEQI